MKFKSIDQYKKNLKKRLTVEAMASAKGLVTRSTNLVQNTAKSSILAGGSGATVQRYNPRRTHTVSAPLSPPASDTGFLVSQITMNVETKQDGTVIGQIISAAPYSKALEFGTVDMRPRPFMQPALNKNKRKIVDMFVKEGLIE